MAFQSGIWLHSPSVVVTAEFHNPSILNPDFLRSQRIVPMDWEPKLAITTPQFSNVQYGNGISWTVDQSKLTVVENCESQFQQAYLIHGLVVWYLRRLPHVPYRSLGLNCVVAVRKRDPQRWLTKRYLRDGSWLKGDPAVESMIPKFILEAPSGSRCFLSLDAGTSNFDGSQPQPAVIATCNLHHDGPYDSDSLCHAIDLWPQRQDFLIAALRQLLAGA